MVELGAIESLFDAISDVAFFIKDCEGRYQAVNQTLVRRCGFRHKADILGKTALEVHPAHLARAYLAQDMEVVTRGVEIRKHLELHLYPGRDRGWCLTYKTPLRNEQGQITGLVGTSQDLGLPDELHPVYRKIARIAEQLRARCAEPLCMQELAKEAGLSLSRVERLFQRVFHTTPRQMLLQSRLNAALAMIDADNQASIAEVAYACGYTDHSAFSRQFRSLTGMSPMQYRAHRRQPGA